MTARTCRACGCTDRLACVDGCSWVEADLCSACATPAAAPKPTAPHRGGRLATPHQRLYIRTMLRELELDASRATLFHRRLWQAAQLPEPPLGADLDTVFGLYTHAQASALIGVLKQEVADAR